MSATEITAILIASHLLVAAIAWIIFSLASKKFLTLKSRVSANSQNWELSTLLGVLEQSRIVAGMDIHILKNPPKYKLGQKIKTSKGTGIVVSITPGHTCDFYGEFYYKIEVLIGSEKYFLDQRDPTKLWQ